MAPIVLERKLDSLHRCLARIEDKCPDTVQQLRDDPDLQDIVVLNLSRAVQLCVDMALHLLTEAGQPAPETMGEAFDKLAQDHLLDHDLAQRMRKAVGFLNIAVHNYSAINWAIVHAIASQHADDFKAFARTMRDADRRT
ncbi:MAG TPA: DUF86 domain-containing protein [Oleiagrimonas sp.]|nr:DUF86 domain-containing protein [Oleiagrimonas sp.]